MAKATKRSNKARATAARKTAPRRTTTVHTIVAQPSGLQTQQPATEELPVQLGRPRELPSQLPALGSLVAVAPELRDFVPRSRASIVAEEKRKRREAKNAAIAEAQARQRGRRQVEQLAMAVDHARRVAEKERARLQAQLRKQEEDAAQMAQLRVRLEAGEDVVLTPAIKRKVQRIGGYGAKKPHLSVTDHRVIMELAGDKTQAEIAARIGVVQSTVSRHIAMASNSIGPERRGRKPVLTPAMLSAAARFQFLFGTRNMSDTAAFIFFVYGVRVCSKTISRNLKEKCGFRLGDFRRYPRDRNSNNAIEERRKYARDLPLKYGQNTLYHAIYFDEMKLSRVTKSKAWSICGWIPTVESEFDSDTADHITLLLAASPAIGLVHVEIVEGSVTGETVLDFLQGMMTEYLARPTSETDRRRAFIMDNARIHHRGIVLAFLRGESTVQRIGLEFLPPYSPFLNPLEEVFGMIKRRLWRRRAIAKTTDESKAFMKKSLSEEVLKMSVEDVRQFYFHVEHFLKYALDGTSIYTQQLYENSHEGDEVGLCPLLNDQVEALLDTYLPHRYEEFTPQRCAMVERVYGCKRLTIEVIRGALNAQEGEGYVEGPGVEDDSAAQAELCEEHVCV